MVDVKIDKSIVFRNWWSRRIIVFLHPFVCMYAFPISGRFLFSSPSLILLEIYNIQNVIMKIEKRICRNLIRVTCLLLPNTSLRLSTFVSGTNASPHQVLSSDGARDNTFNILTGIVSPEFVCVLMIMCVYVRVCVWHVCVACVNVKTVFACLWYVAVYVVTIGISTANFSQWIKVMQSNCTYQRQLDLLATMSAMVVHIIWIKKQNRSLGSRYLLSTFFLPNILHTQLLIVIIIFILRTEKPRMANMSTSVCWENRNSRTHSSLTTRFRYLNQ